MNDDGFLEYSEFHCIKINIDLAALTTARELGGVHIARNSVNDIVRCVDLYLKSNNEYLGFLQREFDKDKYEVEFKYKDKESCKDIEAGLNLIFKEMFKKSEETKELKGSDVYPDNYYVIFNSLLMQNKMQTILPVKNESMKKIKI